MFCWRLERMSSVDGVLEAAPLVAYEAVAEGDAWAPAAPRISYVSLPSQVCKWSVLPSLCSHTKATLMGCKACAQD